MNVMAKSDGDDERSDPRGREEEGRGRKGWSMVQEATSRRTG